MFCYLYQMLNIKVIFDLSVVLFVVCVCGWGGVSLFYKLITALLNTRDERQSSNTKTCNHY